MTGSIAFFLLLKVFPTVKLYGFKFFTGTTWEPIPFNKVGILGAIAGTAEVSLVAVAVGFPLALLTAIYISEYAPSWAKGFLVSMVDLMAAVPSIIFGLWGFFALQGKAIYVSRWLSQNFGWIPIFKAHTDPNAASWAQSQYVGSAFIAGICVGMMIIPLACSVMRGVFVLAPIGEREAALALGSTRWGVVRTVVLPFGRGGIIGGTMLGLGRALGETIAVLLIISTVDGVKVNILTVGTQTVSALIAGRFNDSTGTQLDALLAAGFVLFVLTLGVNTIAAVFVSRSRSGAGT
jgi:phosphate transport system permease protein